MSKRTASLHLTEKDILSLSYAIDIVLSDFGQDEDTDGTHREYLKWQKRLDRALHRLRTPKKKRVNPLPLSVRLALEEIDREERLTEMIKRHPIPREKK